MLLVLDRLHIFLIANKGFRVRRRRQRFKSLDVKQLNGLVNHNQGPENKPTTLNGWFPTLGFGGSMNYFGLEKMMDESVVAKTLREANLWWKDKIAFEMVKRVLKLSQSQTRVNNLPPDPKGIPSNASMPWKPWK
ncbi:hypothetical protein BIW11_07476 [Tropilaelaps mercedesae]|uniref:Uncharacterized protein n=1 Tax=Tropilaelaps mercedesae TaxID=418985 RepID=A0A1V9XU53_9ACAR|nr:hypothetical protein BIW11_07476 [Tropilaelaps mercedesae]